MAKFDITEAKAYLEELIEAAIAGEEEIIITKDNQPLVKLVPVSPEKKRWPAKAGSAKGMVTLSADFEEPIADFEDYLQ